MKDGFRPLLVLVTRRNKRHMPKDTEMVSKEASLKCKPKKVFDILEHSYLPN